MTVNDNPADDRSHRFLVTGGSGFIGTNLIEELVSMKATVMNIDVVEPHVPGHQEFWSQCDVLDASHLKQTVRGFRPTDVVHLSARTDLHGQEVREYNVNIDGVSNMLHALSAAGTVRRAIFASSRMVCEIGNVPHNDYDYFPPNAYGRSKVIGEQLVRAHTDLEHWTIVRPTSIWGPWFGIPYRDFFMAVLAGRYVHPRKHPVKKSFGYVGNTVFQLLRLLKAPLPASNRRTFYLADYSPVDVEEMANIIRRKVDRGRVRQVPLPVLKAAAVIGDGMKSVGVSKEPPLTSFRLRNLCTDMVLDTAPLSEITGKLPYDMTAGVELTLGHLRAVGALR
jgi:nucleoside-diphosphate-sugar epimerase